MGQIFVIAFEGFVLKRYEVSQSIAKSVIRASSSDNCLYIRPTPVFDNRSHKYLHFICTESDIQKWSRVMNKQKLTCICWQLLFQTQ